ncbi:hypothetical protein CHLNCDRAFT_144327 [Chlorella variabilis]|uniref:Uncharacterized protein n=1 Tax=Chlorella variabilis TaxID=554065 RepID=E1ZCF1_CHLVA|nr:hypothetical protein CHLNCDRAFT_144327 [Chlorella variabilis]EFN56593.1 hypothetical protein CHLNCDRAFT_144327 [Chlorella variabilis]|eukprot:XP_005848695.1 hypothetical protein CHLNCDRAFT_144327 [Chlorella variabilis]
MEPHCRVCHETESGPRGLQDILVSPCHCLHNWQLHKALALRDAARCEVCGQPYRVPADAWRAYAAAGCESGAACAKALAPGGTLVVYGAMSHQPVTIPPGLLIFNDIRLRGFWLTGGYAKGCWRGVPCWLAGRPHDAAAPGPWLSGTATAGGAAPAGLARDFGDASHPPLRDVAVQMKDGWRAKEQLVDHVCALFRTKVIRPCSVDCLPLDQWQEALKRVASDFRAGKVLLTSYAPDEVRAE